MKNIFILPLSIVFLIGCGGGGGSSSSESSKDVNMILGTKYTVFPGNKLESNSTNALVEIFHTDGKSESSVKLLAGKASIIRTP